MQSEDAPESMSTERSPEATPEQSLAPLLAEAERLGIDLDADACRRFACYLELIEEWRPRAGLTAIEDPAEMQRRHFGESLALLQVLRESGHIPRTGPLRIIDVGSGAGFPGLPMRIVEPRLALTLVESHARRARFLELVASELGLDDVRVVQARAEDAGRDPALREHFDLVVARAVAPLAVLAEYAIPLLQPGGVLAAPKGSRAEEELEEAAPALAALGATAESPVALSLPSGAPRQLVLIVPRAGELDARYPRRAGIPAKRPLA